MEKQLGMPFEYRAYRNDVSQYLLNLRGCGDAGRKLAQLFLEYERKSSKYKDSETIKLRKIQKFNESIREKIRKGNIDDVLNGSYNKQLDSETADMLSEAGYCERVRENKNGFISLGNVTFDKLIESDYEIEDILYHDINLFTDHNHIVELLFSHDKDNLGYIRLFRGLNSETFKNLGPDNLLDFVIKYSEATVGSIEDEIKSIFMGLDKESLEETIKVIRINPYYVDGLRYIMNRFDLDKESFFYLRNKYSEIKNISYWSADYKDFEKAIIENIELFKGLDVEVAELLINNGCGYIVAQHPEVFGLKKEEKKKKN